MVRIKFYFSVSAILFSCICFSQQLFVPRNIQAAYQKGTRSADGKPGKAYWQNTASYKLNVSFAPDTRLISGSVDITYVNNSPDTLKQIWFKLYPNLYKKGTPHLTKISPEDLTDGLIIDSMWTNDKLADGRSFTIDGTNMTVNKQSLAHGQSIRFQIKYHYTLNKGSHNRTGQVDSNSAFIAYFFPRIAVYDDIDGWNRFPYNGSQEFYNDFCSFDAHITV
ncbi:MAG: peptidase, partial [Flavisolibacter sp.]|nr:peptidase [Flavisolibacter sp.]